MKTCELCKDPIKPIDLTTDGEHEFHEACWLNYLNDQVFLAGIPRSVIEGETKLSDHFIESYINYKCNREDEP